MTTMDYLKFSGAVLTSLGGAGAIIAGFSSWLGKLWASKLMENQRNEFTRELESLRKNFTKEIENYKIKLKKSEFIFQKEYEAANEFTSILRTLMPSYTSEDMNWHDDVCPVIATKFDSIETTLRSFLSKHGVILPGNAKDTLGGAINTAGQGKFLIKSEDISDDAIIAADKLYNEMKAIEGILIDKVFAQASI